MTIISNQGAAGAVIDAEAQGDMVLVEGPALFSGGGVTNTLLQQFSGLPTSTWPTSDKATFRVVLNSEAATRNAGQYVILGGNSTHGQVHINPAQGDALMRVLDSAYSASGFVWVWDKPANFWPLDTPFWFEYDVLNPGVDGSDVICRYSVADTPTPPTVWDEETTLVATATNDPACGSFAYTELNIGRHSSTIEMPTMSIKYLDCERVVSGESYRVWFTGDDITATELDADEMVLSSPALGPSGEGLTIRRADTGPVTTIVHAGTVVWINPDDLDTANLIVTPADPVYQIDVGDDHLLGWVGQIGNSTSDNSVSAAYNNSRSRIHAGASPTFLPISQLRDVNLVASNAFAALALDPLSVYGLFTRLDRATNTHTFDVYDSNAVLIERVSEDVSALGVMELTLAPLRAMWELPGSFSSMLWDKGPGIVPSDDELDAIAAAMLANANRPPTHSTGVVPPADYNVRGDTFTANNGDKAQFNGVDWDPVSPATGVNMAVLLGNATFLIDAAASVEGEDVARNSGLGGRVLDAQYGAGAGADTNDPTFLPHDEGDNYINFPGLDGASSNRMYSQAATSLSGDSMVCTVRFKCFIDDLGTGLGNMLIANGDIINQRGFEFYVTGYGVAPSDEVRFTLRYSQDGSSETTVPTAHTEGTSGTPGPVGWFDGWVRVTNVAGGTTTFEVSDDGVTWTVVGAPVAGALTVFDSPTPVRVGSRANNTYLIPAAFYEASVVSDTGTFEFVGATDIVDGGASEITTTSGHVMVVERATTGLKTALVTRPTWLFGTDDYLQVPDNDLLNFDATESLTAMALVRRFATPSGVPRILSKRSGAAWLLGALNEDSLFQLNDGAWVGSGSVSTPYGELGMVVGVRDITAGTAIVHFDGGSSTPPGTPGGDLTNGGNLRIGAEGGGAASNWIDAEISAAALWRRALTADEIAALNTYYGTA